MKGALVFIAVFLVVFVVTIAYSSLPPGLSLYYSFGFPNTTYPIFGYPAPTFAAAILNGVIYGVIIWLIYSIVARAGKSKNQQPAATQQPQQPQQASTPKQ